MAEAAVAAHDDSHHDAKAHERHYMKIWAILTLLLVLSVAGVEVQDVAGLERGTLTRLLITLFMAFGIAVWKAYLVVKHFMHLTVEPKYVAYLSATALAFMGLFFFFVAPDVMKHQGTNWENLSAKSRTGETADFAPKPIREAPAVAAAAGEEEEEEEEEEVAQEEATAPAVADAGTEAAAAEVAAAEGQEVAADGGAPPGPVMTSEGITEGQARRRASFIRGQLLSSR